MVESAEFVIIGAGAAAASAAYPLVEAGRRVLVLDAGSGEKAPDVAEHSPVLADLRLEGLSAWRERMAPDLRDLDAREFVSPRLRPVAPQIAAFNRLNHVLTQDFASIGLLGLGGLSRIWGAGASIFDSEDLRGFPIGVDDLSPSYGAIIARMGISGSRDDDMAAFHGIHPGIEDALPPGPISRALLAAYDRRKRCDEFRLGRARVAVLTKDRTGRHRCELTGSCNFRCRNGAVYDAAFDFAALAKYPNFVLHDRFLVHRLRYGSEGWLVEGQNPVSGERRLASGQVVVLAAGTISSTRLALDHLRMVGTSRRIEVTPVHTAAFLVPALLGSPLPRQAFAMAELSFRHELTVPPSQPGDYVFGSLFAAGTIPNPDLASHMPFTRPGAAAVTRVLQPALALSMVYLGGHYSQCTAALVEEADGRASSLQIQGGVVPDFPIVSAKVRRLLAGRFRRYGAWLMPGSWGALTPGLDVHYGASLPMGEFVDRNGRLPTDGPLYVVDGAALSRLPAKSLTLTIMANADRIGRHLARA